MTRLGSGTSDISKQDDEEATEGKCMEKTGGKKNYEKQTVTQLLM